jgi:hypothetical protein
MKERILKGWTFIRALYLLMGVLMIVYSIKEKMWAGILFGSYFASMGLFAFGCAAGQCYTPRVRQNRQTENSEAVFEEVK